MEEHKNTEHEEVKCTRLVMLLFRNEFQGLDTSINPIFLCRSNMHKLFRNGFEGLNTSIDPHTFMSLFGILFRLTDVVLKILSSTVSLTLVSGDLCLNIWFAQSIKSRALFLDEDLWNLYQLGVKQRLTRKGLLVVGEAREAVVVEAVVVEAREAVVGEAR